MKPPDGGIPPSGGGRGPGASVGDPATLAHLALDLTVEGHALAPGLGEHDPFDGFDHALGKLVQIPDHDVVVREQVRHHVAPVTDPDTDHGDPGLLGEPDLSPDNAGSEDAREAPAEATFRLALNEDAMATEKLAEGIRNFITDQITLEQVIAGS